VLLVCWFAFLRGCRCRRRKIASIGIGIDIQTALAAADLSRFLSQHGLNQTGRVCVPFCRVTETTKFASAPCVELGCVRETSRVKAAGLWWGRGKCEREYLRMSITICGWICSSNCRNIPIKNHKIITHKTYRQLLDKAFPRQTFDESRCILMRFGISTSSHSILLVFPRVERSSSCHYGRVPAAAGTLYTKREKACETTMAFFR
jgi:hypothetical protein